MVAAEEVAAFTRLLGIALQKKEMAAPSLSASMKKEPD